REAIGDLNRRGNNVVVVDHDPDVITAAQRVIEIGPAAGVAGGEVVFDGTPEKIVKDKSSITGQYLSGERGYLMSERRKPRGRIKLHEASGHNLKNIDVEFPLGCLCVVTGVSGAGKSTLVQETLYPAICRKLQKNSDAPLPFRDVTGLGPVKDVVLFDQSPPGKSSRSNPVTYVKAFDEIRKAFAETQDAKSRGLTAKHFSFNVKGGRCDRCEGDGFLRVDMQFMADILMKCEQCNGARYRDEVLAVKYRKKNIADVLNMTVREAFSFFRGQVKLQSRLKALIDVGLEYIRLGQSSATMSSGEAQRLKLALHLNVTTRGRSLFVLDEPTCGLHMNDVAKLVECFESLIAVGHSLIVVEHDLSLIKHADWIIDMGPGPADDGGMVVAQGTPEEVAVNPDSITGKFLKKALDI
ncbi:MAG: excinuclease ABC subunit A, partial [Planctomycetota bacterium]